MLRFTVQNDDYTNFLILSGALWNDCKCLCRVSSVLLAGLMALIYWKCLILTAGHPYPLAPDVDSEDHILCHWINGSLVFLNECHAIIEEVIFLWSFIFDLSDTSRTYLTNTIAPFTLSIYILRFLRYTQCLIRCVPRNCSLHASTATTYHFLFALERSKSSVLISFETPANPGSLSKSIGKCWASSYDGRS